MTHEYQTYTLDWEGIALSINYAPSWCSMTAHLEVRSADKRPLPITETGYRSHFTSAELIEAEGGPVAFARAWLDHAAQLPAWKEANAKWQQLSLF
jgi:hypothetical protein